MTNDEKRIVEWLRLSAVKGLSRKMPLVDRLDLIRRAIFGPRMLCAIFWRLSADAIERGDHKKD